MISGLSGSLLSHDALEDALASDLIDLLGGTNAADLDAVRRRLHGWQAGIAQEMGPASAARAVFDSVAAPLVAELGFRAVVIGSDSGRLFRAVLETAGRPAAALLVTDWGRDPAAAWRDGVRHGIGAGVRWCFCVTGPLLRVIDSRRTYSRRFAEFDLAAAFADPDGFTVMWSLLRAGAFTGPAPPGLDRAVTLSEKHRADVRSSLQQGVHHALIHLVRAFASARGSGRRPAVAGAALDAIYEESLVVIYRILFLLFAEARGLVPRWHPIYRDSYTIESLRAPVERSSRPRGLWESLQAIARLAHRGCHAGTLRVPPFNGRLFSPALAPLAEAAVLDDGAVGQALLALTTRASRGGRQRIAYADLGVEQLGGVYERVLDFVPASADGTTQALTLVPAERRKSTGSFYTPRPLTEYLVRRTLAPLVRNASPDRILDLRVLDPAMGSGAFLVATCRYLALAYESALVRDGVAAATDITDQDRAGFRRAIAQRCLFGVDINPMAVQLGRLSLWLATLAADRPLTFLDHHLRAGNSLVGAALADVARQPRAWRHVARSTALPLFDAADADGAMGATIGPRLSIARDPGDTIEQVRAKERALAGLLAGDAPLTRWKTVADLWCAGWFGVKTTSQPGTFGALVDEVLGRGPVLPRHTSAPLLSSVHAAAARERFFHWTLEFPEVFYSQDGRLLPGPGFDAVVGNPPWETLRGDRGDADTRRRAADAFSCLTTFTRSSGVYRLQGGGHANLYQLFLERALSLARRGGRVGLILPSGFASDHGCAALRRHAIDHTAIDTFVTVENRGGLFPIHRGLKFVLLAATAGGATSSLPSRSGVRSPEVLEQLPDDGVDPEAVPLSRALLERLSGEQLAIPEIRTAGDLSIASRLAFSIPALGDRDGWHVTFGRELNATEDRRHFVEGRPATGRLLPVVEGKQIHPFVVDTDTSRFHVPERTAARILDADTTFRRARLGYRDVAASTNRLTLIAALIPAGAVTTHTVFCLKGEADETLQQFLCGVFNSFVANYLVRLRVGTHVTVSIMNRLPVPAPARDSAAFVEIAALSARLGAGADDPIARARLQARVAWLYSLTAVEFQHVLGTFPLVDAEERAAALHAFSERRDAL